MCGVKKCTKCKIKKLLSQFSKDKRQKYGVRPECKACENLRASRSIKNMRGRIQKDPNYKGMELNLTKSELNLIPNICYFCALEITSKLSVHRLNKSKGYLKKNVTKTHRSCHQKYHVSLRTRDIQGKFKKEVA